MSMWFSSFVLFNVIGDTDKCSNVKPTLRCSDKCHLVTRYYSLQSVNIWLRILESIHLQDKYGL